LVPDQLVGPWRSGLVMIQNFGRKMRQKYRVLGWTHPYPEISGYGLERAASGWTIAGPAVLSRHPLFKYRLFLGKL
jgi:hypothetical protein